MNVKNLKKGSIPSIVLVLIILFSYNYQDEIKNFINKEITKKDIIVVDLKRINQISPFIEELDCLEYAINKEHLNKINNEMGRIMRRSDSALDYIPTQYITDFVKSITHNEIAEYAGIEYKSVMHENGYNLAIFNPELFECIDTEIYKIDMIDYRKHVM